VDLLVRTGGERRISNFLLWNAAYAELVFSERLWPEFEVADLFSAIADYQGRDRRFGKVAPVLTAQTAPDSASAAPVFVQA